MICFWEIIKKFDNKGEKTGWRYIEIDAEKADKIRPSTKKAFPVKGKINAVAISGISLLPMGDGSFIFPLKNELRKQIDRREGDKIYLELEYDEQEYKLNPELLLCLQDEPSAYQYFSALPAYHQKYFSKWVEAAKTQTTQSDRIARILHAMQHHLSYSEMMNWGKNNLRL